MKTQIIRIEPHDDAISIKDKMEWCQTSRILLVWPNRVRLLNRRLDIIFLKRHAVTLGAQLAFVTRDSTVRYHAKNLNIPVYTHIRKAEETHWRPPSRHKRKKSTEQTLSASHIKKPDKKQTLEELGYLAHPKTVSWLTNPLSRLGFFTIGVLGVIAIALLFLPNAVIQISPKTEHNNLTLPISASIKNEKIDFTGKIPIQKVSVTVEGRGSIPSTGSIEIPDKKATGKVLFENLTDLEITIPAGTIVSTLGDNPVRFYVTRPIEIDPGTTSELIPVEAVVPGKLGNVSSNKIRAIEGPLGLDLTVNNPMGTSGGSIQKSPAPSDQDYQAILEEMIDSLQLTAVNELRHKLNPQDTLLEIDPDNREILEIRYFPEKNLPSDQLQLTLQIAFQAFVISGEDLLLFGELVSDANVPIGFIKLPRSLKIQSLTKPNRDDEGDFHWDIKIEWQSEATIEKMDVIRQILMKTLAEAEQTLKAHPNIEEPIQITLTPKWWNRLPILPFRIDIVNKR